MKEKKENKNKLLFPLLPMVLIIIFNLTWICIKGDYLQPVDLVYMICISLFIVILTIIIMTLVMYKDLYKDEIQRKYDDVVKEIEELETIENEEHALLEQNPYEFGIRATIKVDLLFKVRTKHEINENDLAEIEELIQKHIMVGKFFNTENFEVHDIKYNKVEEVESND